MWKQNSLWKWSKYEKNSKLFNIYKRKKEKKKKKEKGGTRTLLLLLLLVASTIG